MRLFLLIIATVLISVDVVAAEPTCSTYNSSPYCAYTGKVQNLYVNDGDLILMYFDSAMDLNQPASVGLSGVATGDAAAIKVSANPEFAKMFYSTALAAQASERSVTVQMRNTFNGYLVMDRIWLAAP
ncbi:hypothetical protein R50072_03110 [Simiduia litorea]|uniref:hypothetical protein n=1 Tax=Simiduia litorea TaxID=1435348 RepID=UPI0036F3FDE9